MQGSGAKLWFLRNEGLYYEAALEDQHSGKSVAKIASVVWLHGGGDALIEKL